LPEQLIAQNPIEKRGHSKLMLLNKQSQAITHLKFNNILDYLTPNDVLVLNDAKVLKARLFAKRETGGQVEIFLSNYIKDNTWNVLLKPSKRIQENEILYLPENTTCKVIHKTNDGSPHTAEFTSEKDFLSVIDGIGTLPLPPYIKIEPHQANEFENSYQTVYAKNPGAVAAPTAGLHFTEDLIHKITQKGVQIEKTTLHVGIGTFKPVESENILDHKMHKETYCISDKTALALNKAKKDNKRIISVGTTVTRTLESNIQNNEFIPGTFDTDIFIYPGYQFKAINGLLTNFHLPKSTLLMLISAFASKKFIEKSYKAAIAHNYRFYSFGDAMLILE
jgi:S-adenosylmethionine:tRNA ribosyltransferase-isomerase